MRQTYRWVMWLCLVSGIGLCGGQAHAQATPDPNAAIATFVLRLPDGTPIRGATCLIESAMWGVPAGQTSVTIAAGPTDVQGRVSFDTTLWPNAPYRVHFTASTQTLPAVTFADLAHDQGDFTPVLGGTRITYYLVRDPSGSVFRDHSQGRSQPAYQPTPELDVSRPFVPQTVPAQLWAIMQTMSAGQPTPGQPPALTPGQLLPAVNAPAMTLPTPTQTPTTAPNTPTPTWLLVLLICAGAISFLCGRRWLYPALGITYIARPSRSARLLRALRHRPAKPTRPARVVHPAALPHDPDEEDY